MPFATVAIPFDAYAAMPSPQHRWVLMSLARYADRNGRCWPSMRQLARDARISKSSVQRYLVDLGKFGAFSRTRRAGDRYHYTLADAYRPGYRHPNPVSKLTGHRVPFAGNQQVSEFKHQEISDDSARWEARLRGWQKRRMWLNWWGPKPGEAGYWGPVLVQGIAVELPRAG